VEVFCPFNDKYEYPWKGQQRTGENFVITLICTQDPSKYCHAHLKKATANALKHGNASKVYKYGMRFVMSRGAFVTDAKIAYVSAPLKYVVNLAKTKMDAVLQGQHSAAQPLPTSTVAGSGANQCFDVVALVQ